MSSTTAIVDKEAAELCVKIVILRERHDLAQDELRAMKSEIEALTDKLVKRVESPTAGSSNPAPTSPPAE